ncbi:hypothetical protein MG292_03915 [Flavobacterium keumense]|uniref:Lipoprotein n=1 Tax=Flavobacterium keumense TaxID=1306518 RepID=A0ABY8N6W1_9FLAO|nr:hypothetical protein [Flavobacterium keumense]WGK95385.1 hypothetical protein MG292_03915 [Flavobacterium keumense]
MYNTSFFKKLILILVALILYSCDKDYNAIGADLLEKITLTFYNTLLM